MRVNEVISRCSTEQKVIICYDNYHIYGRVNDIIDTEEYRENRIGDMLVTKVGTKYYGAETDLLYVKAVG